MAAPMPFFSNMSIRRKLISIVMVAAAAAVCLACAAFIVFAYISDRRDTVQRLDAQAQAQGQNCQAALAFTLYEDATSMLSSLENIPTIVLACLYDKQGKPVAVYRRSKDPWPNDAPIPAVAPTGHTVIDNYLHVSHRVLIDGEVHGTVCLVDDMSQARHALVVNIGTFLLALIVSLSLALGLASLLQRSISRPVELLAAAAREVVHEHDYSIRADKLTSDELGDMVDAFNSMLSQIQKNDDRINELNLTLEKRVAARTSALSAANEELEAFAYSVSHDLRAPLRSIDGFSHALEEDCAGDVGSARRDHIARIRRSAQRMAQLIDDLLDLSRVTRADVQRSATDVTALVTDIIQEQQREMPGRTIALSVQPNLSARVDHRLVSVSMKNLVNNAFKFTALRDEARIEFGKLDVDEASRAGYPGGDVFYLRDNGVGFSEKYAHKLFVPFQRLHGATEYPGTGIGLALVRRIIHRHGGRIWAQSEPDKGTTFFFTLRHHHGAAPEEGTVPNVA